MSDLFVGDLNNKVQLALASNWIANLRLKSFSASFLQSFNLMLKLNCSATTYIHLVLHT